MKPKNILTALILTITTITYAQTYTYDRAGEKLVISGNGKDNQITLNTDIGDGEPIPNTIPVEYFGPSTTVVFSNINFTVDPYAHIYSQLTNRQIMTIHTLKRSG